MAEKRFIKGLFKDTAHIDQPEGTWRYAKNMILNEKEGSVSNEGGTDLAGFLNLTGTGSAQGSQFLKVIGVIEVDNDRAVIFSTEHTPGAAPTGQAHEIGLWENGVYTVVLNINVIVNPHANLNFSVDHPIEGTFKIDSKGDLIVYWTDDLNPPRTFNISRQQRSPGGFPNLYGILAPFLDSIDILNLFPYSGPVPHIHYPDKYWKSPPLQEIVGTGGGLRSAVYYLALAYVDEDFTATNYLTVSNPVSIVDEFDSTFPTTKKDGIKEGSQTTKSITWRVENLNTDYKYIRPVIIRKMGMYSI